MTARLDRFVGGVSRPIVRVLVVVLLVVLVTRPAAAQDDIVLSWNEIAARTATATSPFNQARIMAIVQLAVFEAVNAITGRLRAVSQPADGGACRRIGGGRRRHGGTQGADDLFPAPATVRCSTPLVTATSRPLRMVPAKTAGIAVGMAAANAMIALRATDGSATPPLTTTRRPRLPGDYALTTGCAAGLFYNWQNVTPFGIASPADFLLPAPPALGSNQIREGLRRGEDRWRARQRGSPGRSSRGREALRGFVTELRAEHGHAADRRRTRAVALGERAGARADHDGHQRQPHRVVLQQVSLQPLAPGNGDPRRRRGWQRQDRRRYRFRTVHPNAVFPELSLEPRERHERRSRGDEASVRRRGPRHHDHEQRSCARDLCRRPSSPSTTRSSRRSPTMWMTRASTAESTGASTRWRATLWDARSRPRSRRTTFARCTRSFELRRATRYKAPQKGRPDGNTVVAAPNRYLRRQPF